jgi:hypothetical protein
LPPCLRDLQANDFNRASASDHAFDLRDRETSDAKIDQQLAGKAVRHHQRFRHAFRRVGE